MRKTALATAVVLATACCSTPAPTLRAGDSSGEAEFVNGLIEHNLIYESLGYGSQIKHQLRRTTSLGMPASGTTIIRHNVVSRERGSLSGVAARPNVLVGHWPLSGAGSTDIYQIYGNVLYANPYEALFQGEGNVALHDNLLINPTGLLGRRRQPRLAAGAGDQAGGVSRRLRSALPLRHGRGSVLTHRSPSSPARASLAFEENGHDRGAETEPTGQGASGI